MAIKTFQRQSTQCKTTHDIRQKMMEKARRLGAWGVEAAGPSEKSQDSYQTGSAPDTQKGLKLEEQVL